MAANPVETVLGAAVRAVVESCAQLGVDRQALLAAAGLDAADLEDSDRRLPVSVSRAVWDEAERQTRDPAIALLAAEALPIGAYKIADYLVAYSPTVGEGLRRLASYFALIAEPISIDVEEGEGVHRLRLGSSWSPGGPAPRFAEFTLASIVARTRTSWGLA